MPLNLTHPTAGPGGTPLTIDLPDQLSWPNEFDWQPVVQTTEHTTTGALVIDVWVKQAGRPITQAGNETRAWCKRSTLLQLSAWASQPGLQMTLSGLRGTSRTVVFDHSAGAIKAEPVFDYADPTDNDPYIIELKFLEI